MIDVVLAEDQAMVRGGLAALLSLASDVRVVGEAADGVEAEALVRSLRPDVLVADIEMPRCSGLDLAHAVQEAGLPTRVLILTTFARSGYLRRALDAGALGYLLKDAPSTQLLDAVRRVHAGLRVIDPELAANAWAEPDPLTDRERQALRLAGLGRTSAEIAATLGIAEGTVKNHLSSAIGKLGAANRVEAARIAHEQGWL